MAKNRQKNRIFAEETTYTYMKKQIFTLAMVSSVLLGMPLHVVASTGVEVVEQSLQDINITLAGNNLHVTGANGQTLYIYKVTGVCVQTFKVEGMDKRYELNLPKGCYIVKVGDVVRKISIR